MFARRVAFPRGRASPSVDNLEGRAVLWPCAAMIVDPGGADIGVAEPFLHLSDVCLVVERVGRGRRAQCMCADLEPEPCRIGAHKLVNAVGRDRLVEPAGPVVAKGPEQRAAVVGAVTGPIKVVVDETVGARM
jgi:hypothetical protein